MGAARLAGAPFSMNALGWLSPPWDLGETRLPSTYKNSRLSGPSQRDRARPNGDRALLVLRSCEGAYLRRTMLRVSVSPRATMRQK